MLKLQNDEIITDINIVKPHKNHERKKKPEKFSKLARLVFIGTSTIVILFGIFFLCLFANKWADFTNATVSALSGGIFLVVIAFLRARGWLARFKKGMSEDDVKSKIAGIIKLNQHITKKYTRVHISGTANFKRDDQYLKSKGIIKEISERTVKAISDSKKVVLIDSHLLIRDGASKSVIKK